MMLLIKLLFMLYLYLDYKFIYSNKYIKFIEKDDKKTDDEYAFLYNSRID